MAVSALARFNEVFVANGLHGDGVTDDYAGIQAIINAAAPNATISFGAGVTYAISQPIDCRGRSIHIDGGNSTFKMTAGYPNNHAFLFGAILAGSSAATWTQSVTAGTSVFTSVTTSGLSVGDTVFVALGTGLSDDTLPDYSFITTITALTESSFTTAIAAPSDVSGTGHFVTLVTALGDNSSISNVGLDWGSITPDTQIYIQYARNMTVKNIFGRFAIAVAATYSRSVAIDGVNGTAVLTSSAGNRVLTTWQAEGITIRNVNVLSNDGPTMFFLEGNSRNILIENVVFDAPFAATWSAGFIHTDCARGVCCRNIILNNVAGAYLVSVGSGSSENGTVIWENLQVNGTLVSAILSHVRHLTLQAIPAGEPVTLQYTVPLTSGSPQTLSNFVLGIVRRLYIKLPTGITAIYLRNEHDGPAISSSPALNQWIALWDGSRNDQSAWNSMAERADGACVIEVDGTFVTDSVIEVLADIFPVDTGFCGP